MTSKTTKTRDGIRLADILRSIKNIDGLEVSSGSKHVYKVHFPGMRACPIAKSTDVRKMFVPYMCEILSGAKATNVYNEIRRGEDLAGIYQ